VAVEDEDGDECVVVEGGDVGGGD
jgi:hypothetical protein